MMVLRGSAGSISRLGTLAEKVLEEYCNRKRNVRTSQILPFLKKSQTEKRKLNWIPHSTRTCFMLASVRFTQIAAPRIKSGVESL